MIMVGFLFMNCTKYPDPAPYFEDYGVDSSNHMQRKVLVISIDGAAGAEIKTIAPPNLLSLENTGKYTYNVSREDVVTDASSWVSLMTGVGYATHQIKDSSFLFIPDDIEGNEGGSIPFYQNVLNHIMPVKSDYKLAVISPWIGLTKYLSAAGINIAAANDKEVKDSALSVIDKNNSLGVMVLDFNGAELAGNAGDFLASDANYKNAILKIDDYVGQIVKALKERSNYDNEDWLIMVTSSHGGSVSNPKPGFLIASNSKLTKEEILKRGLSTVLFNYNNDSKPSIYATMDPKHEGKNVYDFEKDFTVSLDVQLSGKSGNYPAFFGNKMILDGNSTSGFSFFASPAGTVTLNITSGAKFQVGTSIVVVDGKWHNIALTVKKETNGNRVASMFVDGEFQGKGNLPAAANLNSINPLAIGWQPGVGASGNFIGTRPYGIMFFDEALDSSTIRQTQCLDDITSHPEYKHLMGYWPCDDATGGALHNSIFNYCHFYMHGGFQWTGMGQDVPCSLPVPSVEDASLLSLVVSNTDLVSNILYWLKIKVNADWDLQGQAWLSNFEREIYNQ